MIKILNNDKTIVNVRGSTSGNSNKHSINSFLLLNWKPHTKELPIG
jgi:hypothetical protein